MPGILEYQALSWRRFGQKARRNFTVLVLGYGSGEHGVDDDIVLNLKILAGGRNKFAGIWNRRCILAPCTSLKKVGEL